MVEDKEPVVKQRYTVWNNQVSNIEEAFKKMLLNVQADKPVESITELICDAINTPLF
jgi:hypothetical protein